MPRAQWKRLCGLEPVNWSDSDAPRRFAQGSYGISAHPGNFLVLSVNGTIVARCEEVAHTSRTCCAASRRCHRLRVEMVLPVR
eukprot:COSAG01_NODE_1963_length_8785_cov_56.285402_3_plen_83_part_00